MKTTKRVNRLFKGCLLAFVFLLIPLSCEKIENSVYRKYKCHFVFDTRLHVTCHLTLAMGNTGCFLIVKSVMISGIRHIQTTRNYDKASEDIPLATVPEEQTACLLGANNAIVIGRSNYTGLLMAYEGQCPNCLDNYGGTNYPLTWNDNGLRLECARCKRGYDVNNGVVAAGEGGRQLYVYNASFDGAILKVWN